MVRAKPGDTVTVQYIGTLDNGRIFDSRSEEDPLTFTIGNGQVFPALEKEIAGMKVGEVKNIVIVAADAYGPRLEENILTLKRTMFPADREVRVGQKLSLQFRGGAERMMLVTGVTGSEVTLDGNHALAGLDLTFALKLAGIG